MRAVQHAHYGDARTALALVEDAPRPACGPDDVLVRVKATSVNPIDCAVRGGYGAVYWEHVGFVQRPHTPGRDVAGVVVEAGANVTAFRPGDAVWAGTLSGGAAEFAAFPAAWAAPKPERLSFNEAGALPYVALTAWTALVDHAGLNADNARGKKVMVPRGSGGVGSFAIQLLKAWGAYVATTCSTRNVELVRSLGADLVIDYTQQNFAEVLHDFDVAFDTAFDAEEQMLGILKPDGGAYVTVTSPKLVLIDEHGLEGGLKAGEELQARRSAEQKSLGRTYAWSFMRPNGAALREIGALVDAGKIRPVIDRVLPLDQLAEGHEYCETMRARGKIVIEVEAD